MRYLIPMITLIIILFGCSSPNETEEAQPSNDPVSVNEEELEENEAENEAENETETESEQRDIELPQFPEAQPRGVSFVEGYEDLETFEIDTLPNENNVHYHLKLTMDEEGTFSVEANMEVENLSNQSWEELLFYFIPNIFQEEFQEILPEYYLDIITYNKVELKGITINGNVASYELLDDILYVELIEQLAPGDSAEVTITYDFTIPKNGIRLSSNYGNYYLAQWYPMLATYRDGWMINHYNPNGESYHTAHSDFIVEYEFANEYYVFSTSDQAPVEKSSQGRLEQQNVKEFFIALMKENIGETITVNDIEVRVNAIPENEEYLRNAVKVAQDALDFFDSAIGPYPHQQLDIILDEGGMEYPGIVTAGNGYLEKIIVHEIAHQWFYGVVTNNPYYDAWVDEGLTDFATFLYMLKGEEESSEELLEDSRNLLASARPVNQPLSEFDTNYFASVYIQPTIKLWELAGDLDTALDYLKNYYERYAYTEVDTQEWLRFTKAYFQLSENDFFEDWITTQ